MKGIPRDVEIKQIPTEAAEALLERPVRNLDGVTLDEVHCEPGKYTWRAYLGLLGRKA